MTKTINFNKFRERSVRHCEAKPKQSAKRCERSEAISRDCHAPSGLAMTNVIALLLASCFLLLASNAYASIVLKVAIVNPSPDTEKEVDLEVPLPEEVEPDDIINLGDLELDFDEQKNVYYVHKKFTLGPKDSIVREVEIKDIWLIQKEELTSIQEESEKFWAICKNTEYAAQASFLKNSIDSRVHQIIQLQESTTVTPQEHISNYRKNLERLQLIKADLENLTSVSDRIKPISTKVIWRLILSVIGFLGLVAGIFMIIWQRYMKSSQPEKLKTPEEEGA